MIHSKWLGLIELGQGAAIQAEWAEQIRGTTDLVVLGCEHPATISLGRRASIQEDLKCSELELERHGVELKRVDRGGQATIHSPGQLVIYPLLDLRQHNLSVRGFIDLLHQVTQELVAPWGIEARELIGAPGLYVAGKKLASFGVRVERGVSRHGLAINVRNDLKLFSLIRACGREMAPLTRLRDLGVNLDLQVIFSAWQENLVHRLGLTMPDEHGLNGGSSAEMTHVGI